MKKTFNHFVHALIRTPFSVAKRKLLDKRDHPGTDFAVNSHLFSCGAVIDKSSSSSTSRASSPAAASGSAEDEFECCDEDTSHNQSESYNNTFSDCRSDTTTKYSLKSPTSVSSRRVGGASSSKSPRFINKSGSNRFTFESADRCGGRISPAATATTTTTTRGTKSKKKRRRRGITKFRFRNFCRRKTTNPSVASSSAGGRSREGKSGKCIIDPNVPPTPSSLPFACYNNQCFPSSIIFDIESLASKSGKYRILIGIAITSVIIVIETARARKCIPKFWSFFKDNFVTKFTSNIPIQSLN